VTARPLQVGDRVWIGVPANEVPGHVLSIRPKQSGQVEYVVRTVDLAGRPGENLNLRICESERSRVLRPRSSGDSVSVSSRGAVGSHASR
jgi:hypothetical protein